MKLLIIALTIQLNGISTNNSNIKHNCDTIPTFQKVMEIEMIDERR